MQITIRSTEVPLSSQRRQQIERRAVFAMSRLAWRVQRVDVSLGDLNGPRGGIDKQCRVRVHFDRGPAAVVQDRDSDLASLIDRCLARAGRVAHKWVDKRCSKRVERQTEKRSQPPVPAQDVLPITAASSPSFG
jgi:putative sigma-54 modulation protein